MDLKILKHWKNLGELQNKTHEKFFSYSVNSKNLGFMDIFCGRGGGSITQKKKRNE